MQLPKKQFVVVILAAPFWYAFFVLRGWPPRMVLDALIVALATPMVIIYFVSRKASLASEQSRRK